VPGRGAAQPDNTKRAYCVYYAAHKDYTDAAQWIELLIAEVSDEQKFIELKSFKL
jgi:hypothetical protein